MEQGGQSGRDSLAILMFGNIDMVLTGDCCTIWGRQMWEVHDAVPVLHLWVDPEHPKQGPGWVEQAKDEICGMDASQGEEKSLQHWQAAEAVDAKQNGYLGAWCGGRWPNLARAYPRYTEQLFRGVPIRRCCASVMCTFSTKWSRCIWCCSCGSSDWWYLEPSPKDAQTFWDHAACGGFPSRRVTR